MRTILWLQAITAQDSPWVGSKAFNLAEIMRAGLPVPAGFCVTATAYKQYVTSLDLGPRIEGLLATPAEEAQNAALQLQAVIRAGDISAELRTAILGAYYELMRAGEKSYQPVSVRSSASAEDLPIASFAGQQSTFLNVRDEEQLLGSIRECWASLWSPRAVLYRLRRGLAQQPPVIAVLVQIMVDADAAGVAFSVHPISGEDRVVIEAAWGLGETVVGGESDVDRYIVSRETRAEAEPPWIAHKQHKRVMAPDGGVQSVELPLKAQDARVLTTEQVRQVAEMALALERHFDCPQDVEWAIAEGQLYVLQARPITTQAANFFTDVLPGDDSIWTAGFLNERFSAPVSPLGWSVVRELLEELAFRDPLRYLGMKDVKQLRITRLYRGHPYVNMFVFQTLYKVFPTALLPEDAHCYFPDGKTGLRLEVQYPQSLFDPRFLFSMVRHFIQEPAIWSPWHNYRAWAAFAARHDERSQQLETEFQALRAGDGTMQAIWESIEKAQQLNAELLALHRWSLTCADLAFTLLYRLLQVYAGPGEALKLCTSLVTGLPNKSVELDFALRALARQQDTPAFAEALMDFLAHYGHRSFSLDIYHPSFADAPEQVIRLLPGLKQNGGKPEADGVISLEQARSRAHLLLGRGPLGWLRRAVFEHVLRLTRCYMPLREEQRFYWQRTLALMRHLFLLLGQRMADKGVLNASSYIFFLTKDELQAFICGQASGADYAELAATRQQQFSHLCREYEVAPDWSYPPFLHGNQPLKTEHQEQEAQFKGWAVSPGLAKGRVIVLHSPAEFGKVQRGDVLVAHGVDPGWTPIFGLLNALVLEYGGQLSHGAVVAREYGLPTVAGISGITQLLHDGDLVVVDGLNGLVIKVSEP